MVLPPAALAALEGHARLLLAWTAAINLTAIREPAEVARLHVLDSLAAVPLLRARGVDAFVDLGSGGGFPGVPLAAALPAARALLVDSVGKKARFLETVAGAVGLDRTVAVESVRAELLAAGRDREAWPAVTARAVAPLADLVELAFPLLRPGGLLVAWKRGPLDEEAAAAGPVLAALGGGRLEVHDADLPGLAGHRLVVAVKEGPTPARFPRDPAERRRGPA